MGIVDANNRPVKKAGNGENQPRDVVDVRAIPTGTLIYNLIRYTNEEMGLDNAVHQLEYVKEQQKMVADPPQLEAIRSALADIVDRRYVIANELNKRFKAIDEARMAEAGIAVLTPETAPSAASGE